MALALEKTIRPARGTPQGTAAAPETRLNIDVIFTSVEDTLVALRKAGELADRLSARITLVVPQVVPYPLPLESPPVLLDWNERRFHLLAEKSPVEMSVRIFLCRDRIEMLRAVLRPQSLVVVGGRKRWWPTEESKLARKLRSAGHEVIFAEPEKNHA